MVGNKLSLADIILYYGLHRYLVSISNHCSFSVSLSGCYLILYQVLDELNTKINVAYAIFFWQAGMTFHQKCHYIHICRWFDQVNRQTACYI